MMATKPQALNSSTKLLISTDFFKKPGTIPHPLLTFVEPLVLARLRFEDKKVAVKNLEWKRHNWFAPVSKVFHDAFGNQEHKVIHDNFKRPLGDEELRLRIQSTWDQYNLQLAKCMALHTNMFKKVVECFKNVSESNVLDGYATNLLPENVGASRCALTDFSKCTPGLLSSRNRKKNQLGASNFEFP